MKDLTPKEKAKELVQQFTELGLYIDTAKQCAIIAVDEILKIALFYNDSQAEVIYFKEVKQKIESYDLSSLF